MFTHYKNRQVNLSNIPCFPEEEISTIPKQKMEIFSGKTERLILYEFMVKIYIGIKQDIS